MTSALEGQRPIARFRRRLVASIFIAAFLPFAAAYWIADAYVVDQERRSVDTHLAFTLRTAAGEYSDILTATRARASRLAKDARVAAALRRSDTRALARLLGDREAAVLTSGRRVGSATRGTPVARVVVRSARGALGMIEVAAPRPDELLRTIRRSTPFADGDMLAIARAGRIVAGPADLVGATPGGHSLHASRHSFAHQNTALPGYTPPIRLVALTDEAASNHAVAHLRRQLALVGLSSVAAILLCAAALAQPLVRSFDRVADVAQQAEIDPLTKVANRRGFERTLAAELQRAARHGRTCTLVLADLDDFKRVNDLHGHDAGDAVLVAFATRLRESVRASDIVARLGGEEFALVLPEVDLSGAMATAERVRRELAAHPVHTPGNETLHVTASFGVAETSGTDWSALIRRADAALYAAKRAGKNRVSSSASRTVPDSVSLHAPPAPS